MSKLSTINFKFQRILSTWLLANSYRNTHPRWLPWCNRLWSSFRFTHHLRLPQPLPIQNAGWYQDASLCYQVRSLSPKRCVFSSFDHSFQFVFNIIIYRFINQLIKNVSIVIFASTVCRFEMLMPQELSWKFIIFMLILIFLLLFGYCYFRYLSSYGWKMDLLYDFIILLLWTSIRSSLFFIIFVWNTEGVCQCKKLTLIFVITPNLLLFFPVSVLYRPLLVHV